jgi:hypothetical protein
MDNWTFLKVWLLPKLWSRGGLCGYGMCQKRGRESLHGCSAVGGYGTNLNS